MGWRSRELLCLSLCEEGGTTFGCPDLGDLSRLAVQSASDLRHLAVCIVVRADGGGDGQYVQEISIRSQSFGACEGLSVLLAVEKYFRQPFPNRRLPFGLQYER